MNRQLSTADMGHIPTDDWLCLTARDRLMPVSLGDVSFIGFN